eukprot:SAG22_NODE_54_length_23787_cov_12.917511_1_plen_163_part_00
MKHRHPCAGGTDRKSAARHCHPCYRMSCVFSGGLPRSISSFASTNSASLNAPSCHSSLSSASSPASDGGGGGGPASIAVCAKRRSQSAPTTAAAMLRVSSTRPAAAAGGEIRRPKRAVPRPCSASWNELIPQCPTGAVHVLMMTFVLVSETVCARTGSRTII